jgi:hypothetical protein
MFELRFETGKAVFHEDDDAMADEVSRILQTTANYVKAGATEGGVRDWNGNTIGSWKLQEEDAS